MATDFAAILAPTVRERSLILAPCVLATMLFFLGAAEPLGIRPSLEYYVAAWVPAVGLVVLTVALALRKIGDRWIHLASAATLWCPMLAICIPFYGSRDDVFFDLLLTSIASAGVLLHTPYTLGTLVGAVGAGTLLVIRADVPHRAMYVATLFTAAGFALIIHALMRRAFIRAELLRRAEAEKIVELERAHAERAKLAEQLLHAQRMEAIGTLAAGVAHDMNNVLASISGFATLALDQITEPALAADIQQILSQATRGAELTRGLLAFSRRGQYRKRVVRIGPLVEDVLPLLRRTLPKTITIESDLALGASCVDVDPVHIHQVLINLGLNAADAMAGSGKLAISGATIDVAADEIRGLAAGRYVRIAVSDTGHGIDAATKERMFEPFFTTKPQGAGSGLGLAIVWGVVQAHGGAIEVDSSAGQGATFRIYLPLSQRAPTASEEAMPVEVSDAGRRRTILVVDDEAVVRASTKRLLEKLGMNVVVAENGEDGLRVFAQHADEVELVVLDMGMPVMGGAECFRQLRTRSQVPILIATGYADDREAQELVAAGAAILEKPFTPQALRLEVMRMLNVRELGGSVRIPAVSS